MQNQIAATPATSAVDGARRQDGAPARLETASRSGSIHTAAPEIATTLIRNENSAAAIGATPSASAAASVRPLRETPGRIAIACAQPIQNAVLQLGSPRSRGREAVPRGPQHRARHEQADRRRRGRIRIATRGSRPSGHGGDHGGQGRERELAAVAQRLGSPRAARRAPARPRARGRRSAPRASVATWTTISKTMPVLADPQQRAGRSRGGRRSKPGGTR